jgi:hypothetical protein
VPAMRPLVGWSDNQGPMADRDDHYFWVPREARWSYRSRGRSAQRTLR